MADAELLNLAVELGLALKNRGWKLALAESCTGGLVSSIVTEIPGSSMWFDRGFVTYSNKSKNEMLGVSAQTLLQYGAVSEQTACEMATGAVKHSQAQIAASITGIAGPDGGSAEKPVGTVCFAWTDTEGRLRTSVHRFSGDRTRVRLQSAKTALEGLLELTLSTDL